LVNQSFQKLILATTKPCFAPGFANESAQFFLPTQYKCFAPRMKIWPSDSAGEA